MIETPRLLIRLFEKQDARALFSYLSLPEVYRYEPGAPISLEKAMELAAERAQGQDFWAVVVKNTKELAGHLFFKQTEPPEFLTWELGYIFHPKFHNLGYATESAGALVRYGFEHDYIHRVVAYCNPENIASWKVMEHIGMRREGHLKKNIFFRMAPDGLPLWVDSYAYALLAEDLIRS